MELNLPSVTAKAGPAGMDGAGREAEEGEEREPCAISDRNILDSFTESREVAELIGNLREVFGELVTREMAVERFIGKHGSQREWSSYCLIQTFYYVSFILLLLFTKRETKPLSFGSVIMLELYQQIVQIWVFFSFCFPYRYSFITWYLTTVNENLCLRFQKSEF